MNTPQQPPTPPAGAPPPLTDPGLVALDALVGAVTALEKALASKGLEADMREAHEALSHAHGTLEPLVQMTSVGGASPKAMARAKEYRDKARSLRTKAPHQPTAEQRAELEQRAQWYEDRAAVKESGAMVMPPHLRTEFDQCEVVNFLRRGQATMLDGAQMDISPADVEVFVTGLARGRQAGPLTPEQSTALTAERQAAIHAVGAWAAASTQMLEVLGGARNERGGWDWAPTLIDAGVSAAPSAAPVPGQPVIAPTGSRIPKAPSPSNGGAE